MAGNKRNGKIDELFDREDWEAARRVLSRELETDPENHWLLTQLGVTFYEQRRYKKALQVFLKSREIVPDCPLTLWNVAGALDSLGKHQAAISIYTWILQSERSPEEDPCWESKEWTDSLKTDCVYRLGCCFQELGRKRKAEHCYRQYLNLLALGIRGSYSIDDVQHSLRDVQAAGRTNGLENEVRKVVDATLQASGIGARKGRQGSLPEFALGELVPGRRTRHKQ